MDARPQLSAIVCTLDRGPDIALTVDSLLAQDLSRGDCEILIVDNGSTPENAAILHEYERAHPETIRCVREPRTGLSNARNLGIAESRGDVLVFIDDDAIAQPGWLAAYARAFEADPRLGVGGGKVTLRYASEPPGWLDDTMLPYLGAFDHGERPCTLDPLECPRGGNMAFRRVVFDRAGRFSDRFGRKGECLLSLEEVEICYRVERAGWRLGYVPDASIEHIVRPDRFDRDWFARRFYWQGRSLGLFDIVHRGRLRALAKVPGHVLRFVKRRGLPRALHRGYLGAVARHLLTGAR